MTLFERNNLKGARNFDLTNYPGGVGKNLPPRSAIVNYNDNKWGTTEFFNLRDRFFFCIVHLYFVDYIWAGNNYYYYMFGNILIFCIHLEVFNMGVEVYNLFYLPLDCLLVSYSSG